MSYGKEPVTAWLTSLTHMTGEDAYLCRVTENEVDVWDFYKGDPVFSTRNSVIPEWANQVIAFAVLAEHQQPIWAVLDKDFTLLRFAKEEI